MDAPGGRSRLALLALLAESQAGIPRDKVLAFLWPESDGERARAALRQALYSLRRDLEVEDLILGTSEVRLNPAVISCDLWEFRRALERGDTAAAVALYAGPFLEGVFVRHAPEFERWVDTVRQGTTDLFLQALEKLATLAEASEEWETAARWWRRAALADRLSARVAVRLMRALAAAGDTPAALQHARLYAAVVREELDVAPDPNVVTLARELQEESETRLDDERSGRVPRRAATEPGEPLRIVSPDGAAHEASTSARSSRAASHGPRLRAAAKIVLPVAALALALLSLQRGSGQPAGRQPALNPDVVAILPFSVHGLPDSGDVGEGVGEVMASLLDVAEELRVVESGRVILTARAQDDTTEAARRRRVAESLGAGRIVTGEIVEANGRLRVSAALWRMDAEGTGSVLTSVNVDGASLDLFELIDRLAVQLIPGNSASEDRLARIGARMTASLEALKYYLAGSRAMRRAEYVRAATAFQRATEIDTGFSLAYYRLATAAEWSVQYDRAEVALARALGPATRLAPAERLMAEALLAYVKGAAREAEQRLERAVAINPEDTEAWFRLAEVQFHFPATRDRPYEDSRQTWRNVLATDPNHIGALIHLVRIAAVEQDSADIDELVKRIRALSPASDRLWEVRAHQAFIGGRAEAERAITREFLASGDSALLWGISVAVYTDNIGGVYPFALRLAESSNPEMRKLAFLKLAELETTRGRPIAADRWLARLATLDAPMALVHGAYFATLPSIRRSRTTLDSLARLLHEWGLETRRSEPQAGSMGAFSTLPRVFPELRHYLAGRVAARLGRWDAVQKAETDLHALERDPLSRALRDDLVLSLAAEHALALGDSSEAASLLSRAKVEFPVFVINSSWLYAQAVEQFQRAALASWRGRDDVALDTYAAARTSRLLAAPASFEMAQLLERSGNRAAALREYRRVVHLWSDCEPDQVPYADLARRRIAALGG